MNPVLTIHKNALKFYCLKIQNPAKRVFHARVITRLNFCDGGIVTATGIIRKETQNSGIQGRGANSYFGGHLNGNPKQGDDKVVEKGEIGSAHRLFKERKVVWMDFICLLQWKKWKREGTRVLAFGWSLSRMSVGLMN